MPISLTDDEMRAVLDCAQPLSPPDRDAFLQAVANELEKRGELGPGSVSRVCRELQRLYFHPPIMRGRNGASGKYAT